MPKAKYCGAGNYVVGVPAHDLSHAEWAALAPELREKALAAGTHEIVKSKGRAAPKIKPQEDANG